MVVWHRAYSKGPFRYIERGNPLSPLRGLLFSISSKGSIICTIPVDVKVHTTAFVTPGVVHWLEREIARWSTMRYRSTDTSNYERKLLRSYFSFLFTMMKRGSVAEKKSLKAPRNDNGEVQNAEISVAHVTAAGFLSRCLSGPLPYV